MTKKIMVVINNRANYSRIRSVLVELRKKLRNDILLVVYDAYCEFIEDPRRRTGSRLRAHRAEGRASTRPH